MLDPAPYYWIYDTVDHYRLNAKIVQKFLQELFGDYDFKVEVRLTRLHTFDLMTDGPYLASAQSRQLQVPRTS